MDLLDHLAAQERPRKRGQPVCPRCKQTHTHYSVAQVGRFSLLTPRYKARYDGAPIRDSRDEAHDDYCRHIQEVRA